MRKIRLTTIAYLMIMAALFLTACGKNAESSGSTTYHVYYLTSEKNGIDSRDYDIDMINDGDVVNRLITLMELSSANSMLVLNSVTSENDMVTLDFNQEFYNLSKSDEALIKMAVVKTLSQVPSVDKILLTVEGEYLKDSKGAACGPMTIEDFVERGGDTVLPDRNEVVNLYFADKPGTALVSIEREINYCTANMMESVIVKAIIDGPVKGEKSKAVINNKTEINSIQIQSGICYLDFSEQFLNLPKNSNPELAIYSVVNALTRLDNINAVVITVNGDSNAQFLENYEDKLYTNYGIVK